MGQQPKHGMQSLRLYRIAQVADYVRASYLPQATGRVRKLSILCRLEPHAGKGSRPAVILTVATVGAVLHRVYQEAPYGFATGRLGRATGAIGSPMGAGVSHSLAAAGRDLLILLVSAAYPGLEDLQRQS